MTDYTAPVSWEVQAELLQGNSLIIAKHEFEDREQAEKAASDMFKHDPHLFVTVWEVTRWRYLIFAQRNNDEEVTGHG